MNKELTPEQQKAKWADEIACRVSLSFAGVVLVWQIIASLIK